MRSICRTAVFLASMSALAMAARTPDQIKAELAAILSTGMKARMVWSEYNPNQKLYTLDSDTGIIHEITPASTYPEADWRCMNAHLTHDGSRIMFSSDDGPSSQSYMVTWNATGRKELGAGMCNDYYRDSTANKDYALMCGSDNVANLVNVDNPFNDRRAVGSDMDWDDGITISPDGTHIAAFTASNSAAYVWTVSSGSKTTLDPSIRGCVISIAPDRTYESMHQLAPHQFIRFFKADGSKKQDLDITKPLWDSLTAKGQLASWAGKSGGEMEHDRTAWSNDRNYLTTTFRFTASNPYIVKLPTATTPLKFCGIHDYTTQGLSPYEMDLRIFPRTSAVADSKKMGAIRLTGLIGTRGDEMYSLDGKRITGLGHQTGWGATAGVVIRRSAEGSARVDASHLSD